MKRLLFGSLLLTSLFSAVALADEWTGFVGDSKCAHTGANGEKDAACSKGCIKRGADPVLVTGDGKVMKFDADSKAKAVAHAGETVKVTGSLNGDTITASSVDAASK
jgi:Protein of unknown function (DUF5818)